MLDLGNAPATEVREALGTGLSHWPICGRRSIPVTRTCQCGESQLILIAATGNRYEVALLFHSDLVPPPIFPPFMTSMTAIDSCNTNCSARMTNAGLRLVGGQNVGDGRRRQRRPLHRNRSGRKHHSADQDCANQEYFPHSRSPPLGIALRSGSLAVKRDICSALMILMMTLKEPRGVA